eukprot:2842194-Prymnesium_polylepis.1
MPYARARARTRAATVRCTPARHGHVGRGGVATTVGPRARAAAEHHRKIEHNVWHYLNFIIHIRLKDHTELTGPESYVKEKVEEQDLSFFPILRTSSIIFEDVSNEVLQERIEMVSRQLAEMRADDNAAHL